MPRRPEPNHAQGGESAPTTTRLGPDLQVLVVGGGVVGAGVALDAVSRGLSVGLVEARDFGSGTSSRSSKLIHGKLRYLERLPHLVRPVVSFLLPFNHYGWERLYLGAGVPAYDVLGLSMGQTHACR